MKKLMAGVLAVASLALVAGPVVAKEHGGSKDNADKPSGTISLSTGSVAVGVGYSWGSGVLVFKGKKYPFSIDGLSVGAVGASRASAKGHVYHLQKLEDFNGTYTAASAGGTIGGGGGASAMQNQNGVVIKLVATSQGLKFNLAVDGVKIALKK